ncbi:MAG: ATP-binding protein DrrA1-3 family domain-containing protein, partial [Promethearchaeota archaeon]
SNKDGVELVLAPDTTPQIILDQLRNDGLVINRFEITTPSLHNIFLNIAGGNHE